MKKKVYLTYPTELIKSPLIYEVGHKFDVVTNIRQSSISDSIAIVAIELEGEADEIDKAIDFFTEKGVQVEPIEMNIVE